MRWSPTDLVEALLAGMKRCAARLDIEQAVYGLEALDEVGFHPIIADAFAQAGYGVHREQSYPADRHRRLAREGERCDFVLTPDGRALQQPERALTLFEPPDALPPDEAYWLEMKLVTQHTPDGPNPRYAGQFLSVTRGDLAKLSKDREIFHAGLLLVLLTRDSTVAEHDLGVWYRRCVEHGLPLEVPSIRHLPITDRHGNGNLTLAIAAVRHL